MVLSERDRMKLLSAGFKFVRSVEESDGSFSIQSSTPAQPAYRTIKNGIGTRKKLGNTLNAMRNLQGYIEDGLNNPGERANVQNEGFTLLMVEQGSNGYAVKVSTPSKRNWDYLKQGISSRKLLQDFLDKNLNNPRTILIPNEHYSA